MARNYINWSNSRPNGNTLSERPHVTNTVNGTKRYYSSIDAEIFFGDLFIDEVISIEWAVQQQTMPIFGYNSYCFDDIAVGSRLISGQFVVNFTESGYLQKLQNDEKLTRIARKLYYQDNKTESYFSDAFRQRLNKPVWDGGFDIVVGFGDHNKSTSGLSNSLYNTYLVLDCCQITGSMVQLDYSGNPVNEVYTFIARDIKYNTATSAEQKPTTIETASVNRSSISLQGVVDLSGNNAIVKLGATDNKTIQSASIYFTDSFNDRSLSSSIELSGSNDKAVSIALSQDKTKRLKAEIQSKGYTSLKAQTSVKYFDKSIGSENNSLITSGQTLRFSIKTS